MHRSDNFTHPTCPWIRAFCFQRYIFRSCCSVTFGVVGIVFLILLSVPNKPVASPQWVAEVDIHRLTQCSTGFGKVRGSSANQSLPTGGTIKVQRLDVLYWKRIMLRQTSGWLPRDSPFVCPKTHWNEPVPSPCCQYLNVFINCHLCKTHQPLLSAHSTQW